MDFWETGSTDSNELYFVGKKGKRVTIIDSQIVIESTKDILLINLKSIAGFYCEKHGKFFKIRISSRSDADFSDVTASRGLISLSAEDTQKFLQIIKSKRM